MSIKMPTVKKVICLNCGTSDLANWSDFGSEQPCLNCDSAPVYLVEAK